MNTSIHIWKTPISNLLKWNWSNEFLNQFQFRRLENSIIEIWDTTLIQLIFNLLKWNILEQLLTNNSSNQKYNTIKQAINPATLLIGSIGLSRDISINSTVLNSQGQHLDSPNPNLSIPSNSSSSPPSKPQFNPVNHTQRVPQQVSHMTSSIRHHYVIFLIHHLIGSWFEPIILDEYELLG